MEQVEDHVGDADPAICRRAFATLEAHPLLERLERRPSARVETDDLAVQDRTVRAESGRERTQFGVMPGHVEAVAAHERERAALDAGDASDAVPLQLEAPARVVARQRRNQLREHGHDRPRENCRR